MRHHVKHDYMYIHIYIYISVCVCVCVRDCARSRDRFSYLWNGVSQNMNCCVFNLNYYNLHYLTFCAATRAFLSFERRGWRCCGHWFGASSKHIRYLKFHVLNLENVVKLQACGMWRRSRLSVGQTSVQDVKAAFNFRVARTSWFLISKTERRK